MFVAVGEELVEVKLVELRAPGPVEERGVARNDPPELSFESTNPFMSMWSKMAISINWFTSVPGGGSEERGAELGARVRVDHHALGPP